MFWKLDHEGWPPPPPEEDTRQSFHGSFLHLLWSVAKSERFMESIHGNGEGHEASTPGVYASDQFETSIGNYGWAIDPSGDGRFYRFGWTIRAKHTRCREGHERYRGNIWHDIVFPAVGRHPGACRPPRRTARSRNCTLLRLQFRIRNDPAAGDAPQRCAWEIIAGS